jgi:hypothetical protein
MKAPLLKERITMAKKKKPLTRKQALADVERLHKAHKDMVVHLEKVKKNIRMMPHFPPYGARCGG